MLINYDMIYVDICWCDDFRLRMLSSFPLLSFLAPQVDESVVQQLTSMGFPVNGCRRAVHSTGNTGRNIEI